MIVSTIRTYFKNRIAEVDAKFSEWAGSYNAENVPKSVKNKSYLIEIGTTNGVALGDLYLDHTTQVKVSLFFKTERDHQAVKDLGYEDAHSLMLKAMKPSVAMTGANIKNVICESINPEPIVNNDNVVIIELQFSVRLIFAP